MKKNIWLVIGILSLIANIVLALMVINVPRNSTKVASQFPYLSKRIFVENQNDILINFIPLRQALKGYIENQGGKVGVYFEYLPSGTSIGVNDREEVKLASLSKVPLAMSIYKKIERRQMSLTDSLVIKKEHLDLEFGNLWKRGEGTKLSVEELLRLSLVESDNTAYFVLADALSAQEVNEVYESLDIPIEQVKEDGKMYPLVSPKNYSSIFRSLYLASFISEKDSNHILEILTQTPFDDKIVTGLPKGIPIAHKIGVFTEADISKNVFVDCGIVYVPNRPYILCIFTKDTNEHAQKHMVNISKMIYGYIIAVKANN